MRIPRMILPGDQGAQSADYSGGFRCALRRPTRADPEVVDDVLKKTMAFAKGQSLPVTPSSGHKRAYQQEIGAAADEQAQRRNPHLLVHAVQVGVEIGVGQDKA